MLAVAAMMAQAKHVYQIYPIPQEQHAGVGQAAFSSQVNIVAEPGIDAVTIDRARQVLADHGLDAAVSTRVSSKGSNLLLGVNGSKGVVDQRVTALRIDRGLFTLAKYDRHILSLTADKAGGAQVVILGENTDAVFCGLASLEQMLDGGHADMPCVTIHDWADVQIRGIIEGYYGVPYSAEVTKDLFRFMARYKMNTYMYGAKSDEYHSRYWSEPYPTSITPEQKHIGYLSQDMMRDITATAHACNVNFIWAIHPGQAFADANNPGVIDQIMCKFESMYGLGVRQFGVFVDDVGVPSDPAVMRLCADNLTTLQQRVDARWNSAGVSPADAVGPLCYVPQLYAYGWVSLDRGQQFYESLRPTPSKVNVFITGRNVWSVPNNHDLSLVQGWIGREVSWWWNYLCNDNDVTKLFVADMYTNFRDETHIINTDRLPAMLHGTNTVIVNPMQQGELSKIGLFSVADCTWNTDAFNNERSWEASIGAVLSPRYAKAFRTVAPHLRYYDNDALDYYVVRYWQSVEQGRPSPGLLIDLLSEVHAACKTLKEMRNSAVESDRLFYDDLRPWLLRLEAMTAEAVSLLRGENPPAVDYDNNPAFQFEILGGMGEHITLATRTAQPSATVLAPFIARLRQYNQHLP